MKCARNYGQKYAVTQRSLKREESSKTSLNWPKKWDWKVLMRTMVRNGCSPVASFNNDKLRELADQPIQSEFTACVAEQETSVTEISKQFLSTSIIMITQIIDHFTSNNLDYKWSPNAKRGDLEISCY
jgi:hypothetical protein